jgi:carboxyl-terminal processing protease
MFRTVCGDTVYGGGGITPKIFVGLDTGTLHKNISRLYLSGDLTDFMYNYYIRHIDELNKYSSPQDFTANYNDLDPVWQELVIYAAKDSIDLKLLSPADKEFLQKRIKAQLARYKWRSKGFYEVANSDDPVIRKALEELAKMK